MKNFRYQIVIIICLTFLLPSILNAQGRGKAKHFNPIDLFELEYASDPQISPDGTKIVYVRTFYDIMTDRTRSNLWVINYDGTGHRPLTSGNNNYNSPVWSPDGNRLLYLSNADGSTQIYMRWMDTGHTAKTTNLSRSPGGISWSPDGKWLAFTMFVQEFPKTFAKMPPKPRGAEWARPSIYIDKVLYRRDGGGYVRDGYTHIFIMPAEGNSPRQMTFGEYDYRSGLSWTPDSRSILFSVNLREDRDYETRDSDVYKIAVEDGSIERLTDRYGPDTSPAVSPDGTKIIYTGYDDKILGFQVNHLYLMDIDGSNKRLIGTGLDRGIQNINWSNDGRGVFVHYNNEGNGKIAYITLDGDVDVLCPDVGGLSIGRPYSGGTYSLSSNDRFAYTHSTPYHPADLAVGRKGSTNTDRLTYLNDDLFSFKELGQVEEVWYNSSYDNRRIQGWICKPPGFDPGKKYPLVLEIHGGPFANYGDRFAAEVQLYASAGYVVLYTNPRGSTSYGEDFGNLIHHNYPGQDYDDLMSGVDAVIAKGYIDEDNLFVTGGSGGGVLSSWIVGHTGRFRAAVVQKPVINWYSWTLTADGYTSMPKYWFPGLPWDNLEHYMKRSPISYVGNVTTPTMLLTGEVDYRTPMSESEQFYQALKLMKVESALVRVPGASHGIAARPSNLIGKIAHIIGWFEKYRTDK
ncbi:MAG: S9 family peptidase [bacterium]|nr:S9 family peptidase [bacterium]